MGLIQVSCYGLRVSGFAFYVILLITRNTQLVTRSECLIIPRDWYKRTISISL